MMISLLLKLSKTLWNGRMVSVYLLPNLDTIQRLANVCWLWNQNIWHMHKKPSEQQKLKSQQKDNAILELQSAQQSFETNTSWKRSTTSAMNSTCFQRLAKLILRQLTPCFISGFRHKLTFIMRTIPDISAHLRKIDQVITHDFIPSITGGVHVNEVERKLLSLPTKFGGLCIPIFEEQCVIEHSNSRCITSHLCEAIGSQFREFTPHII